MTILTTAWAFAAATSVSAAGCKLLKVADLPVTMIDSQPRVSAKINGSDVVFLADTGAFYSTIPTANAAELHLSAYSAPFNFVVAGVGGEASAMVTLVDKLDLAGSAVSHIEFIVAGSGVGTGTAGVLGENVLGLVDGDYDLAHAMIRLVKPEGCDRSVLVYWVQNSPYSETPLLRPMAVAYQFSSLTPSPRADVFLDGKLIRAMLDTGASRSVVSLEAARRAGLTPSSPGVTQVGFTAGVGRKISPTWIATFPSFKIGDEQIKNAKIEIADISLGDVDMLLGADFFLAHHVFLSNSQRKIYFTYNGGTIFNIESEAKLLSVANTMADPDEGDADTLARLGEASLSRGEIERALSDLIRAHLMAPQEPLYDYQLGRAHLAAREPVLAEANFNEALKSKPDYAEPRLARAQMGLSRHDDKDALDDLDVLTGSLPKEASQRLILADDYNQAEAFPKAIIEFDHWIKAHSEDARLQSAYIGRCWAKAQVGTDLQGAFSDCNRASRIGGISSDGLLSARGLVRLRLHDDAGALKDYDAALRLNPKNAWALYGRSIAKSHLGLPKAQEDALAAVAITPTLAEIWKSRALTP